MSCFPCSYCAFFDFVEIIIFGVCPFGKVPKIKGKNFFGGSGSAAPPRVLRRAPARAGAARVLHTPLGVAAPASIRSWRASGAIWSRRGARPPAQGGGRGRAATGFSRPPFCSPGYASLMGTAKSKMSLGFCSSRYSAARVSMTSSMRPLSPATEAS